MNMRSFSGPIVLAIVIGLVLGFACGVLWKNSTMPEEGENVTVSEEIEITDQVNDDENLNNETDEDPFSISTVSGNGSIEVNDQTAGESVMVDYVEMNVDGWVAVREDDNGQLGNILGAVYADAGAYENVAVRLLRNTEAEKMYYVVLFEDNGDRIFNHTVDSMLESEGDIIIDSMMTTL